VITGSVNALSLMVLEATCLLKDPFEIGLLNINSFAKYPVCTSCPSFKGAPILLTSFLGAAHNETHLSDIWRW